MAWSFTAFRGAANNKASGATLTVTPNAAVPVGAVLVAVCLSDNIATGGGQTDNHAVTDFKGNQWVKVREQSNAAAAGAGITASVWVAQITTQLQTTDAIVFGLSSATVAKAIAVYQYSVGPNALVVIAGRQSSEQDSSASPTVTLSGLAGDQVAFFGIVARENDDAGTYTPDPDFNDRQKFGTTGGTAATNVSAIVGDRIGALASETFNPTALAAASDVVSILVALREIPATLTCTKVRQINGVVYVDWSDGVQQEFRSLADAIDLRDSLAADTDLPRKLAIARYLRVDPDASNPSLIEGHSITLTDQSHNMVTVQ